MSSMGDGGASSFDFSSGMTPDVGSNSYDFSTGLGNIDPNSGLNSLNAGLMGPGAGTMPNGFTDSSSNYIPSDSGVSAGALNGNTMFTMPTSSMPQALSQALGMGSKLAGGQPSPNSGPKATGSGKVSMHQVVFANPIQNFAGSVGGSQSGNSLLQMLAKYHPGAAQ